MKTNKNITLDIDLIRAVNGTLELNDDARTFSGLVADLLKDYIARKSSACFKKAIPKPKRVTGAKA